MATEPNSTGATIISLAPKPSQVIPFHPGGCPAGVEPHQWRKALKTRVQSHLAIATGLLALLDDMEADCDLEDGGDSEPSLGAASKFDPVTGWETDLEDDDVDMREGDEREDCEYSLGWTTAHEAVSQLYGSLTAGNGDLEADYSDYEPSLGSPEIGATVAIVHSTEGTFAFQASQTRWANGTPGASDMEEESVNEDGEEAAI